MKLLVALSFLCVSSIACTAPSAEGDAGSTCISAGQSCQSAPCCAALVCDSFLLCAQASGDSGPSAMDADPGTDAGPALDTGEIDGGPSGVDGGPSEIDGGPSEFDSGPAGDPALFADDFESGFDHEENGVRWTQRNAGNGDEVSVSDERGHSGDSSVRFHFAGGDASDDGWAELRFDLGEARDEVYVGFWIYFPNGTEPGENRYSHTRSGNNKVLRVWAPDYNGFKWGASMWPSGDGLSEVVADRRRTCGEGIGPLPGSEWSMSESDLGRWMHWEIHVRGDDGSGNGAYEFWVDGEPVVSQTSVSIEGAPCAPNHFVAGYLLGWSNSGFDVDTNIYVDDVTIREER